MFPFVQTGGVDDQAAGAGGEHGRDQEHVDLHVQGRLRTQIQVQSTHNMDVYFSFCQPPASGGGQYYELLDGLGGKYADLLRKKREFKGEEVGKRGYFHCTWGKQYNFGKRAGGKNIIFFGDIYTPAHITL